MRIIMDNKAIGKFIADRRKEKGFSQMQLAEKIFVTDKAISKWETGKGTPDVSNLISLADALEVSVTEILNGKRIENNIAEENNAVVQAIKQTENDGRKKVIKTAIAVVLIFAIAISTSSIGWFAYWGRRHLVLYDMDTVYLTEVDSGVYNYEVEVTARNWIYNSFSIHSYSLQAYVGGEQYFYYDGGASNIIVSGLKKTTFKLTGTMSTGRDRETTKDLFLSLYFSPQDSELSAFSLYMQDYQDVNFVFIETSDIQ